MKDEACGAGRGSAWTLTRSYILGPWTDEIICFVDRTAASDPPPRYYFTKDHLNSTRELINASATVVTSYDYDVWGTPTESHLSGNVSKRYQFRKQRFEGRLCLISRDAGARRPRALDPLLGRHVTGRLEDVRFGYYKSEKPILFLGRPGLYLGKPSGSVKLARRAGDEDGDEDEEDDWWLKCLEGCDDTKEGPGFCPEPPAHWRRHACFYCCRCGGNVRREESGWDEPPTFCRENCCVGTYSEYVRCHLPCWYTTQFDCRDWRYVTATECWSSNEGGAVSLGEVCRGFGYRPPVGGPGEPAPLAVVRFWVMEHWDTREAIEKMGIPIAIPGCQLSEWGTCGPGP